MEATEISMCCLICGDTNLLSNCSKHQDNISVDSLNKFVQQVGLQVQGLLFHSPLEIVMCDDCKSGVVKATGWRDQVEDVERDVRSLQRIILKMMRQLKSLQDNYLEEMKRLNKKMKDKNAEGERKSRTSAIREGIQTVVWELGAFQDGLSAQFSSPLPTSQNAAPLEQPEIPDNYGHAPDPTNIMELPLSQNFIKEELSSSSFVEENGLPDQDPLFTENNDKIDIEFVVYPQSHVKKDPLSLEQTPDHDDNQAATASASNSSGRKLRKKKGLKTRSAADYKEERPHKCPQCSMTFLTKYHLNRHSMIHSGNKPFTCPECKKGFRLKHHLEVHKWTHTEKKPFQCLDCGKGFIDKFYFETHRKLKHPDPLGNAP